MRFRFQYTLRTLFIVITLLAIPCGYVGYQLRFVAQRKALIEEIRKRGGAVLSVAVYPHPATEDQAPTVPWIRRLLGDEPYWEVAFAAPCSRSELAHAEEVFPEARVYSAPGPFTLPAGRPKLPPPH